MSLFLRNTHRHLWVWKGTMSQVAQGKGAHTHRERRMEQTWPGTPAWETWLRTTRELICGSHAPGWCEVTSKHSVKQKRERASEPPGWVRAGHALQDSGQQADQRGPGPGWWWGRWEQLGVGRGSFWGDGNVSNPTDVGSAQRRMS